MDNNKEKAIGMNKRFTIKFNIAKKQRFLRLVNYTIVKKKT